MLLEKLRFIKNVDHDDKDLWAYSAWNVGDEDNLNWSAGKGSEANANKPNPGDLMLLVQNPSSVPEARITHLLEVISDASETIDTGHWGLVRRVRVIWVAKFAPGFEDFIPREQDILGWKRQRNQGSMAVEIDNIKDGKVLELWHSMETFQRHVAGMLGLIE